LSLGVDRTGEEGATRTERSLGCPEAGERCARPQQLEMKEGSTEDAPGRS